MGYRVACREAVERPAKIFTDPTISPAAISVAKTAANPPAISE